MSIGKKNGFLLVTDSALVMIGTGSLGGVVAMLQAQLEFTVLPIN